MFAAEGDDKLRFDADTQCLGPPERVAATIMFSTADTQ
jgi:hypothetical protein